jgi:hypothetical protein
MSSSEKKKSKIGKGYAISSQTKEFILKVFI